MIMKVAAISAYYFCFVQFESEKKGKVALCKRIKAPGDLSSWITGTKESDLY